MRLSSRGTLVAGLAALVGITGVFVVTTVAMDSVADSALIGFGLLVAFALVALAQGGSGVSAVGSAERRSLALAAAGGVLAFWAAPLLALSQRASDAPSGTDTLFLTTSVWGAAAVFAAFTLRAERPSLTSAAGAFAALAGTAGLLASWESPSSFSPFAKFPLREALMLAAALLFAAGVVALAQAAHSVGARVTTLTALGAATVVGVAVALPSMPSLPEIARGAFMPGLYLGGAIALFAFGWIRTSSGAGIARASVAVLCAPLALQTITIIERLTTVRGPDPVSWPGALAGSAVLLSAATAVALSHTPPPVAPPADNPAPAGRRIISLAALVAGALASALALGALAMPALDAVVEGGTGEPFSAAWTMVGAESAAGWLAAAAALLSVAAVLVQRAGAPARTWVSASVAALVCAASSLPLAGTTIHTWNRWIPAEVQQTYGTEYTRFAVTAHALPARTAALALAVLTVAVLVVAWWREATAVEVPKEGV